MLKSQSTNNGVRPRTEHFLLCRYPKKSRPHLVPSPSSSNKHKQPVICLQLNTDTCSRVDAFLRFLRRNLINEKNLILKFGCVSLILMHLKFAHLKISFIVFNFFVLFKTNSAYDLRKSSPTLISSQKNLKPSKALNLKYNETRMIGATSTKISRKHSQAQQQQQQQQHIIRSHPYLLTNDDRQRKKRSGKDADVAHRPYLERLISEDKRVSIFGSPCIYEGHLKTDSNWFGYLANVSVKVTGQMTFELAYPAHMCCQNILFYLEEQVVVIGQRMNCWQREFMLRPDDDQILRLTPSFPWSGCHETSDGSERKVFLCKGGRSFSVDPSSNKLVTWFLAVSNCVSSIGLDLAYRFKIYGHVGECGRQDAKGHNSSQGTDHLPYSVAFDSGPNVLSKASLTPRQASKAEENSSDWEGGVNKCTYVGNVNTTNKWFGFIKNLTLKAGGSFEYMFTQPLSMQFQNVILYRDEDIVKLDWEMTCWQKEGIIPSPMVPYQIMDMSFRATWTGCRTVENESSRNLTCTGHRKFDTPQKIFMSLSNCRSTRGLLLHYKLQVSDHEGPCSICHVVSPSLSSIFLLSIVRLVACRARTFASDRRQESNPGIGEGTKYSSLLITVCIL